jgi:hypothetical protein
VQVFQEAVRLQRKLAETDPSVPKYLADSLHHLGKDLLAIGLHKNAAQVNEEAVRLHHELANILTKDLGSDLHAIERNKHTVQVNKEAVRLRCML